MKTNTCKAKVMILSFLALCLGVVSCYDDTAIWERFEAMETTRIATIDQQIEAIKASITDLKNVDTTIKGLIANLEAEAANLQAQIEENAATDEATKKALEDEIANINALITALQAKDAEIVEKIAELQTYVDSEIAAVKDWTSITFSTLEQYQTTCNEIAAIKVLIAEQEASLTKALTDAIAASETSMKGWVNQQLTGYWTIAETQAKLDTIKTNTDKEVEAVKADLKTTTEELTAAYKSEITKAISDSEGKLSAKIDEINATLNKRIGAIEARLDAIEEKLNNLTREFAIKFDDSEIGIMPGGTTTVGYTITGATEKTIVKAFGQNGWSAKVSMESNTTGSITVKAPNPITEEEIIVLVYDGEYRTIMSSINFVKGFATPSQAAIEFGTEADTATIELTSNIDCKISIPTNAQSWLSVVEPSATRAVTTKSISFACTECTGGIRKATVSFVDEAGVVVSTMSFVQQGSTIEVTLTEAGTLMEAIGQDAIQDIKALIINGPINGTDISCIRGMSNLVYLNMENARIVEGGGPYYIENSDFYTVENVIGEFMFRGAQSLHEVSCEVILPANIIRIEDFAFDYCGGLSSVQMPSTVQSIGEYVFWQCGKITEITLPADLRTIGAADFAGCQLDEIIFPERLNSIGRAAFNGNRIKTLTIPSQVRSIGESAFSGNPLTEIHLLVSPAMLKNIGNDLFDGSVYDDAVLYIPKGTLEDYTKTDFGRFKNIVEKYDNVILDVRDTVWVEGESIFIHRSESLLPGQGSGERNKAYKVLEGTYVKDYPVGTHPTNGSNHLGGNNVATYDSPLFCFSETLTKVRFIVHEVGAPFQTDTKGHASFGLASFRMYDENGDPIELTEENFTTNANEPKEGWGIPALLDDNPGSFMHSLWSGSPSEAHYLEATLPEGEYSVFSFSMSALSCNHTRAFPAEMEIVPYFSESS